MDEREQYLLSALCQLDLLSLSTKGSGIDELRLHVGEPSVVQMRKPTEADWQKIEEKKAERGRQAYEGLLAFAQSNGVQIKTVSRQEFYKDIEEYVF